MHRIASAACAVLLAICCDGFDRRAAAAATAGTFEIAWEVRNRFRLFQNEADFERHAAAHLGDGVLGAERRLAHDSDGRGWAQHVLDRLCLDPAGAIETTCNREGVRESYLAPDDHPVIVRLNGSALHEAHCNWRFDDGEGDARETGAPCLEPIRLRVAAARTTLASVGIVHADGRVDAATAEIKVRDLLIAGLGDSVASGEGNPDRPVELADSGFCFRRFLGSARSEYFRPSRAGYRGDHTCPDSPGGAGGQEQWMQLGARWTSSACHRSLYSYQARAALALAIENPQVAVTFVPLACTGATIDSGLLDSQRARGCPPKGSCPRSVPAQVASLERILASARKADPDRAIDLLLLTVGANDISFSGLVADVIITAGVERTLFQQGGLIASLSQSESALERRLPAAFSRLRARLRPLLGNDLSRVVYVAYGNPARSSAGACPGGRAGLDIHPAFNADAKRLGAVADFVERRFLPQLRALARCESPAICKNAGERMTLVEGHQSAFARRGYCVRANDDPEFDRLCFSAEGTSFNDDPVVAAKRPLACDMRPGEFRPYTPRARWIRTANDSYFAAMTFPQGMPVTMQPSDIHDATWGALSAVYGGAIHPTAEGHAAMADAALPAMRAVLGLQTPPAVHGAPLPALQ